ncbi:hypothetical protein HGA88_05510 [Candidatus Roizmanbacteria bacterium]|nr:hypothetical protein [Candidatus Roizmanbacteria bacterium]
MVELSHGEANTGTTINHQNKQKDTNEKKKTRIGMLPKKAWMLAIRALFAAEVLVAVPTAPQIINELANQGHVVQVGTDIDDGTKYFQANLKPIGDTYLVKEPVVSHVYTSLSSDSPLIPKVELNRDFPVLSVETADDIKKNLDKSSEIPANYSELTLDQQYVAQARYAFREAENNVFGETFVVTTNVKEENMENKNILLIGDPRSFLSSEKPFQKPTDSLVVVLPGWGSTVNPIDVMYYTRAIKNAYDPEGDKPIPLMLFLPTKQSGQTTDSFPYLNNAYREGLFYSAQIEAVLKELQNKGIHITHFSFAGYSLGGQLSRIVPAVLQKNNDDITIDHIFSVSPVGGTVKSPDMMAEGISMLTRLKEQEEKLKKEWINIETSFSIAGNDMFRYPDPIEITPFNWFKELEDHVIQPNAEIAGTTLRYDQIPFNVYAEAMRIVIPVDDPVSQELITLFPDDNERRKVIELVKNGNFEDKQNLQQLAQTRAKKLYPNVKNITLSLLVGDHTYCLERSRESATLLEGFFKQS